MATISGPSSCMRLALAFKTTTAGSLLGKSSAKEVRSSRREATTDAPTPTSVASERTNHARLRGDFIRPFQSKQDASPWAHRRRRILGLKSSFGGPGPDDASDAGVRNPVKSRHPCALRGEPVTASTVDSDSGDDQNRRGKCFITDMDWPLATFAFDECLHSDANKPSFLVLGYSPAAHMWWGLHAEYPNANLLQATAVGCKPVLERRLRQFAGCTRLMDYVLKDYLPRTHVDAVLLEAHWDEADIPS